MRRRGSSFFRQPQKRRSRRYVTPEEFWPLLLALSVALAGITLFILTLVVLSVLTSQTARAADLTQCSLVKSICADSADRVINGVTVSKDCWRWERTYVCAEASSERTQCDAANLPNTCTVTAKGCSSTGTFGGTELCLEETSDLLCSTRPEGAGITVGTPQVKVSYTSTQTPNLPLADGCVIRARTCLDSTPREIAVSNAPGETVIAAPDCWEEALEVLCPSAEAAASCRLLEEAGCTAEGTRTCEATDATGNCVSWRNTFVCRDKVVEGDDITVGESTQTPDGGAVEDASACEEALKAQHAAGYSCTQSARTCVKPNSQSASAPECLLWENTWRCTAPGKNGCATLENLTLQGECQLESAPSCEETDSEGHCLSSRAVYRCVADATPGASADAADSPPERLPDALSEAETVIDNCSDLQSDKKCVLIDSTCMDGPATKLVNGLPVTRPCWKTLHTWTCMPEGNDTGECATLAADPACTLVKESCPDEMPTCPRPTRVYRCTRGDSTAAAGTVCSGEACIAQVCTTVDDAPDEDFATSMVGMEIAREAGVYGDLSANRFFSGEALGCRDRKAAKSCCRSDASTSTANSAFAMWLNFGMGATSEVIRFLGSPYVYDVLAYSEKTSGLLNFLYGNAPNGLYEPTFSFWGTSVAWTQAGGWNFQFSPGGFAAAAAMHFYASYAACRAEDQRVAMMKGERLCHYVGTTCTNKTPGLGCTETEERYVCFNSRLARILNEQGRAQLNRDWGTVEHPDTRGFTVEELGALDFSKMDLSEFVADIVREALAKTDKSSSDAQLYAERAKERVTAALEDRIAKWGPMPSASGMSRTGKSATSPTATPSSDFSASEDISPALRAHSQGRQAVRFE